MISVKRSPTCSQTGQDECPAHVHVYPPTMAIASKSRTKTAPVGSPHDPMLAEVSVALGEAKYEAAAKLLTQAVAVAPDAAALLHCRAAVRVLATVQWPAWKSGTEKPRTASLRLALADFDRVIAQHPDYAEAHLNRGLAWLQLGDRERGNVDLSRALALGLEPVLALQAHSRRGGSDDHAIVNTMRKTRGIGHDWRDEGPQRITLRGAVPVPLSPVAASKDATKASGATKASAKPKTAKASAGPVDWPALNQRADKAYKEAIKAQAAGKGGPMPDEARLLVWLEGFPESLHPAVRFFVERPAGVEDPWSTAVGMIGKRNAATLAKALIGREHPPFLLRRYEVLPAAAVLKDEPEWLDKAAHDVLTQLEGWGNYALGDEDLLRELRALCPTKLLGARSLALLEKLSANKKYQPIAQALRAWGGLVGKPSKARQAEVAAQASAASAIVAAQLEALTEQIVAATNAAALEKLHAKVGKLDLLEASTDAPQRKRIDKCIKQIRAHLKKASGKVATALENILDTATDS